VIMPALLSGTIHCIGAITGLPQRLGPPPPMNPEAGRAPAAASLALLLP
jgi:hypothetical protein